SRAARRGARARATCAARAQRSRPRRWAPDPERRAQSWLTEYITSRETMCARDSKRTQRLSPHARPRGRDRRRAGEPGPLSRLYAERDRQMGLGRIQSADADLSRDGRYRRGERSDTGRAGEPARGAGPQKRLDPGSEQPLARGLARSRRAVIPARKLTARER